MNTQVTQKNRHSVGAILVEFLGSMNLAITVLVAIAIASIIGTLLKQNQAYQDYLIKFGPYWHDVFITLGLYDVYGAWWFIVLLAFLLITTSVCIYRNGPTMLQEMKNYRLKAGRNSLRAFHNKSEWQVNADQETLINDITAHLQAEGYRTRIKEHDDHVLVAAMRGSFNRMGYLFTHIGIVVICIGSLIMFNVPLKVAMMTGQVKIETNRNLPASQVPEISVLTADNASFRGSVNVAEGQSVNIVFLNVEDGYLVQELPFDVELKDFRIEHYDSGQPKSFESDLVIHDKDLPQPLEKTISVNYPLIYKGYAIYQASFSDGGSKLSVKAWPLLSANLNTLEMQGEVFGNAQLSVDKQQYTIEFSDFRLFNINPVEGQEKKFKNFGPSFTFKLRDSSGQAREYVNYMSPIEQQGRLYILSGVRESVAEPFRYLYIPADSKGSLERFMKLNAAMRNDAKVKQAVDRIVTDVVDRVDEDRKKIIQVGMTQTTTRLISLFVTGGVTAINKHIQDNIPEAKRQEAARTYFDVLRKVMAILYLEILAEEGADPDKGVSQADSDFFDDALNTLGNLQVYGSPFYLGLTNYTQIQASGLQVALAPGKEIIVLGCVLLIVGIFIMFYVHQRRCWAWISRDGSPREVIFAGASNRNERDFTQDFSALQQRLARRLGVSDSTME